MSGDRHNKSSIKRLYAIALSTSLLLTSQFARAEWSASAGFESFDWKESTSPEVKESGLRWALDLTWAQSRDPGLSAGYNLKFYNGNVDYTGAGLFTGTPISGETHYRGVTNEVLAFYRMPQSLVDFVLAAGWDRWDRKLNVAQEESWDVVYGRLGVLVNSGARQGFMASIGVKYPLWTRENAHFDTIGGFTNPRLRPGKDLSLFGTLGYRVNPSWDVIAYYDSYRFKESNTVAVPTTAGTGFFFQPESRQDVVGMKVQHNF